MGGRAWLTAWRGAFLALTAAFWAWQFTTADIAEFGWQFRFLTNWGLTLSLAHAVLAWRAARDPSAAPPETLAIVAALVNGMVVYLYWSIRLSGGGLGEGEIWSVNNLYLHAVGPGLQIVDAVFVMRVFARPIRAVPAFAGVVLLYILWIELAVAPLNAAPAGSATSGLPYPFLNDLHRGERATFYGQAATGGLLLMLVFHIVTRVLAQFGRGAGGAAPAE